MGRGVEAVLPTSANTGQEIEGDHPGRTRR